MKKSALVYLHDERTGILSELDDGGFRFVYDANYVDRPGARPVSQTLPVRADAYESDSLHPFFDGLIPEGWLLEVTLKNWKIDPQDRFGILLAVGHDCIGAVRILENAKAAAATSLPSPSVKKKRPLIPSAPHCLVCLKKLPPSTAHLHPACAKDLLGLSDASPVLPLALREIEALARTQINRKLSLPGVQRKLSLHFDPAEKKPPQSARMTWTGYEGDFILKPPSPEYPQMPEVEHTTMRLAREMGFRTAVNGLVYLSSGELAYLTRRFDRNGGERIELEDGCQLSEKPTAQKYKSSTEALGKVIRKYSKLPGEDRLNLLEWTLFSFVVGNADMHLKNFSIWRDPKLGIYRLAPAYDFLSTRLLIPAKADPEELCLTVNARKSKLKLADFAALAKNLEIPEKVFAYAVDKLREKSKRFDPLIEASFMSKELRKELKALVRSRLRRLS
jgi:serine/threonine-protein kinase HipA